MYKKLDHKILIFCAGIFFLGSLLFAASNAPSKYKKNDQNSIKSASQKIYSVVLSDTGFTPQEIVIKKGDTIKFSTILNQQFWPASDLHPNHGIYPEFDPKKPVEPNSDWSFTFEKVGSWKYHDHLFPMRRGTIVVFENSTALSSSIDCQSSVAAQKQCWQEQIEGALNSEGLDSAFQVLSDLYNKEPSFAQECHGNVHKIGEAAYEIFSEQKELKLTAKTSYCGFGFYHGFMETLLQKSGNIAEARSFCRYAGEKLKNHNGDAEGACYHGIGHGAVDGSDPRTWGDPQLLMAEGLKLCEKVTEGTPFIYRCSSGVFNSLAIMYFDPKYELTFNKDKPYKICETQTKEYFARTCYEEMNTLVFRSQNKNFSQAAKLLGDIQHTPYAVSATQSLAGYAVHAYKNEARFEEVAQICLSLQTRLRTGCITGFASGLVEFGSPEQEHVKAVSFCDHKSFSSSQKESCFERVLWLLSVYRPKESQAQICASVKEQYKKYCQI